jgi:hypothetical protein
MKRTAPVRTVSKEQFEKSSSKQLLQKTNFKKSSSRRVAPNRAVLRGAVPDGAAPKESGNTFPVTLSGVEG